MDTFVKRDIKEFFINGIKEKRKIIDLIRQSSNDFGVEEHKIEYFYRTQIKPEYSYHMGSLLSDFEVKSLSVCLAAMSSFGLSFSYNQIQMLIEE